MDCCKSNKSKVDRRSGTYVFNCFHIPEFVMGMLGEGAWFPAISCKQLHILINFWYMVGVQHIPFGNLLQFFIFTWPNENLYFWCSSRWWISSVLIVTMGVGPLVRQEFWAGDGGHGYEHIIDVISFKEFGYNRYQYIDWLIDSWMKKRNIVVAEITFEEIMKDR